MLYILDQSHASHSHTLSNLPEEQIMEFDISFEEDMSLTPFQELKVFY